MVIARVTLLAPGPCDTVRFLTRHNQWAWDDTRQPALSARRTVRHRTATLPTTITRRLNYSPYPNMYYRAVATKSSNGSVNYESQ
jgi:hypothetical protein